VASVEEVEESDKQFRVYIRCAAFTADELTVYAEPQAITVKGKSAHRDLSTAESAVREHVLFGRYDLPQTIETDKVSARLENGVLEIVAKKVIASKSVMKNSAAIPSSKRKTKQSESTPA
jgi:HSP20 family molecular chaperone IbpA